MSEFIQNHPTLILHDNVNLKVETSNTIARVSLRDGSDNTFSFDLNRQEILVLVTLLEGLMRS